MTHLSILQLESIALGHETLVTARTHIDECPRCSERLNALRASDPSIRSAPEFAAARSALLTASPSRTRRQRRRFVMGGSALLALAAAWAITLRPGIVNDAAPTARLKGTPTIAIARVDGTGPLRVGDRFSLEVGSAAHPYVMAFAVDERGEVTQLWPTGDRSATATPGPHARLPVTLEATPGSFWLEGVFSDAPLQAADLRAFFGTTSDVGAVPAGAASRARSYVAVAPRP